MRADRAARAAVRRVTIAGLALLAAACDSPTVPGEAPAYDPTALTGGRLYRWPLGAPVRVHVAEWAGDGSRPALRPLVRAASDAWIATLRYRELSVTIVERVEEAEVVIAWSDAHPVALDACGRFGIDAAFTLLCPDGDAARRLPLRSGAAGVARIAVAVDAGQFASADQLAAVVAHEVGHALGVGGHSGDVGDVMYADPRTARPSARDARTLRYVLHRPIALRLR